MTLDEAIKRAEEAAEEQDMKAGFETDYPCYQMSDTERNQYKECAEEHRQLAEWLKELKQLREQEPCDDCISRQAALSMQYRIDDSATLSTRDVVNVDDIEDLPPVTPQPKMGHWIIKDGKEQGYDIAGIKTWYIQIMCDKCGFIKTAIEGHTGQNKFCPKCGAKMQEVEK